MAMKLITLMFLFGFIMVYSSILVSAEVLCDTNYIALNLNQSQPASKLIHCTNTLNSSVTLTKSGNYFNIDSSSLNPNQGKDFLITFDTSAPENLYTGQITFSDSSNIINLFFNIKAIQTVQTSSCIIDIFPTSFSNIKIQQGDNKVRNIQISIPECMKNSVNIRGANLQTDEKPITLGELSLGTIQPGKSIIIPIVLDASSVSTGQYSDTLQLLIYDSNGTRINVPNVNINVMVTSGISPISNFSFSQLPSCTLDSISLNLNGTYKLTCSINNPNFLIKPDFDKTFIKGNSVNSNSNQYIYEFNPIKVGKTTFCAEFLYQQSVIGLPFCQEIKINPTSASGSANTNLDLEFFQNSIKKDKNSLGLGKTRFLVVDSTSRNIITSYEIYLNGEKYNSSEIDLEYNKLYDLRVSSDAYNTLVTNLSANIVQIVFSLIPEKTLYKVGEPITFNSSIENVTYLVDNVKVSNPFYPNSASSHTITAVKEGYISSNKTIDVEAITSINTCEPSQINWKKGSNVVCSLSKVSNWSVSLNSNTRKVLATGNSNELSFKIEDYGNIEIKSNDDLILSTEIKNKGFFELIKEHWIISSIIVLVILFFIIIYLKSKNPSNVTPSYS